MVVVVDKTMEQKKSVVLRSGKYISRQHHSLPKPICYIGPSSSQDSRPTSLAHIPEFYKSKYNLRQTTTTILYHDDDEDRHQHPPNTNITNISSRPSSNRNIHTNRCHHERTLHSSIVRQMAGERRCPQHPHTLRLHAAQR